MLTHRKEITTFIPGLQHIQQSMTCKDTKEGFKTFLLGLLYIQQSMRYKYTRKDLTLPSAGDFVDAMRGGGGALWPQKTFVGNFQ